MRFIALAFAAVLAGCATTSSTTAVERAGDVVDGMPDRLPAPETGGETEAYLMGSHAAMRAGKPADAAVFLDAILRSDRLSERGRAEVYWLAADAHRMAGHDAAVADALGGFLVAAEVIPPDDDMKKREVDARSALLARKVRDRALFGKSPDAAIPVEDARDPSGIVAELGCVEDAVSSLPAGERRLEERRLMCRDAPLTLFFDVTLTR